jgi:hypothetical protein
MEVPFVLASQPGVQFTHPVIGQIGSGDTLLYVFYQTNLNGNWDIYYLKYLTNGTISAPVPVRTTAADQINFHFAQNNGAVWEENGAIVFGRITLPGTYPPGNGDTIVLEQGDCHNPVFNGWYCAWEKNIGSDTLIHYSAYNSYTMQWEGPYELASPGSNTHLAFDAGLISSTRLMWQTREGALYRVKYCDLNSPSLINEMTNFLGYNDIEPAFTTVLITTKGTGYWEPYFKSFASDTTGNYEIYVNDWVGTDNYINMSDLPGIDHHPQFFASMFFSPYGISYFLTWESLVNYNSQIWMSYFDVPIGINEKVRDRGQVTNYPNPFKASTNITYKLDEPAMVSAKIFSGTGVCLMTINEGKVLPGIHTMVWNGNDDRGHRVPAGIYYYILNINNLTYQGKLVVL